MSLKRAFLTFSCLVGALLGSTSFDLQKVQSSIDSSYTYIYSSLLTRHFAGNQIALTYGPLGFLAHTLDIWHLELVSIIVSTLLGALTGYLLYLLLKDVPSRLGRYGLSFVASLVVCMQIFEWKLLAIFLLAALLAYLRRAPRIVYGLAVAAALLLDVKLSLGITAIIVLLGLCIILKLKPKTVAIAAGSGALTLVASGLVLFASPKLAASYFINGLPVSAGYAGAMGFGPAAWQATIVYILLGTATLFALAYYVFPKHYRPYLWLLLIASFFVWKASVTRQDPYGHVESLPYFMLFTVIIGKIMYLRSSDGRPRYMKSTVLLIITLLGLGVSGYGLHVAGLPSARLVASVTDPLTIWKVESCKFAACTSPNQLLLDPVLRQQIGQASVDVYPWETLYTAVNKLNWQSRPSPASYGSYTPKIDNLDARFWGSSKAPRYLLWDIRQGILSIDGRHLFFDEPQAVQAMLANYSVDKQSPAVILLKHKPRSSQPQPVFTAYRPLTWNSWFNVTTAAGKNVTSITYKPDLKQTVGAAVFRPTPVFIELQKRSGQQATFRVVPATMPDGLMLSELPFNTSELITDLSGQKLADPVVKARFIGAPSGRLQIANQR